MTENHRIRGSYVDPVGAKPFATKDAYVPAGMPPALLAHSEQLALKVRPPGGTDTNDQYYKTGLYDRSPKKPFPGIDVAQQTTTSPVLVKIKEDAARLKAEVNPSSPKDA